jgi:hypothetical protein
MYMPMTSSIDTIARKCIAVRLWLPIKQAVPAWEEAQRQAIELLGDKGIAPLDKAAKKSGMFKADRQSARVFLDDNCIYNE